MPKGRVILTTKQRIMVALTYRKLKYNASEIGQVIGSTSQQVNRDLNESNGLIPEGLVEKDSGGSLHLTGKGKADPLVRMLITARKMGTLLLILSLSLALIILYAILSNQIVFYFATLLFLEAIIFYSVGLFLWLEPQLLIRDAKLKAVGSNDPTK